MHASADDRTVRTGANCSGDLFRRMPMRVLTDCHGAEYDECMADCLSIHRAARPIRSLAKPLHHATGERANIVAAPSAEISPPGVRQPRACRVYSKPRERTTRTSQRAPTTTTSAP